MDGKVSFTLTDTHGDENPIYNLSVSLEGFDSPDSLLAGLDRLREIIEVRYQRKFQIGVAIENNEEGMLRLQQLKQMIQNGNTVPANPDISDLYYQVEAAISAANKLFIRHTNHPLADPSDEPSRFPHVNQDDPNKPGVGDQL